jgi:hypothetical protein
VAQFDSIRFQPSRPLLKEVSADRLNAILSEIKKNRPRGERGITVRQAGDATYIGLAANFKGGGTPITLKPWDIYVENASENTYTVKVYPGTLGNNLLASNWDDEFTLSKDQLYYAKAVATTDGQIVTGLSIVIDESPPEQQTPLLYSVPNSASFLFGLFYNFPLNLGLTAKGIAEAVYSLPRTNPPPGEYAVEVYYRLQ